MKYFNLSKSILSILTILALDGCSAITGRETTGQYMTDAGLTANVKGALIEEPSLSAFQIHVETFKGVVQLSGFVDTYQQVLKAGEVARRVQGVRTVKNDVRVTHKG